MSFRFPVLDCPENEHLKDSESGKISAEQAHKEGYACGLNQARDKNLVSEKEKLRRLGDLMAHTSDALKEHKKHIRAVAEKDTVALALSISRELVFRQIKKNHHVIKNVLGKALEMVRNHQHLCIKAHPDDCEIIRASLSELIADSETAEKTCVKPDQSIQQGGCLVETDFGVIDARVETQLKTTMRSLRALVNSGEKPVHYAHDCAPAFQEIWNRVKNITSIRTCGLVSKVVGLVLEANGPAVQLGCMCDIYAMDRMDKDKPIAAEVLGFRDQTVLMMPLEEIRDIGPGSRVVAKDEKAAIAVGSNLLGRIIDGLGNPIDDRGPILTETAYPIYSSPINPLLRKRISTPLDLGIRCINGLLTVGCGQRMGIFAGSGVGKSVLMGMIARKSQADVNVIALIGERGRELNEFIDKELGPEGLKKSVVVVATSDHLPLVRVRGAFVATAIAEYFRDQGLNVNLMMDSLTRFAMAQREIGLALGEPPTTKGYTPSVFTLLPKLLERTGTSDHSGSITGLYTVLVEGDDMNEPIADAARSILDGHIVLSRDLADQNHYPAIDVLRSVSRVMEDIASLNHKHNAGRMKEMLATYRKAEDLINIGAYVGGSNPNIDLAISKINQINGYLCQQISESIDFEKSVKLLEEIMNK
ncbi:MAG: flagellar protein export ATPase FliI [Desulfobacteraceae bacterium]|nr:flagellar protein export ATPase FliI [Desulfobacteraceae bacterium]